MSDILGSVRKRKEYDSAVADEGTSGVENVVQHQCYVATATL